jgi:nucleoside-diphosphate-sugar epimerase
VADYKKDERVSETASLERFSERRGWYSASKQQAEDSVIQYMKSGETPVVILRPGTIYGPGGDLFTSMMGFSIGRLHVVIDAPGFTLPFVYVDNVVDAIARSIDQKAAAGEIFNVVDPEPLSKRQYIERVIRRLQPNARVFYLPYSLLYGLTWAQEWAFHLMKRRPALTRYRLTSSQKPIVYNSDKIGARLGWRPRVSQKDALESLIKFELARQESHLR